MYRLSTKLIAEFMGTFWLVLCGCGSAVLAAAFPDLGIGFVGVSLAFGLSVLTMAAAFERVSGAHFNPAVSVGLWAAGRFPGKNVGPYVAVQVLAAILASVFLLMIAAGQPDFVAGSFATNGYGIASPGNFSMGSAFFTELVFTFMFVAIILGVTNEKASTAIAPLAIGLTLTLIHLVTIPVTNTSVNPARSTGPAFVVGGAALAQLWLFWLAPLLGGAIAGWSYLAVSRRVEESKPREAQRREREFSPA
ncbi:MAG TPA: aquaporin Z [Bdellovibrionales bacterium]|nr:aquaporin Z [Bdellovibrionales bacterium]